MSIRRVVPDIAHEDLDAARRFYGDFLGFDIGMDMGWVVTFVSPDNPTAQITVMRDDASATLRPDVTVEVRDADALYEQACTLCLDIVHPLTDEPWGVRRFFVKDPKGTVINVMMHRSTTAAAG